MEKTEIKLTEKQLAIFNSIQANKQLVQNEAKRVQDREVEFLVTLCDAHGVEAVEGIEFKDGSLFIPKKTEPVKVKKLK